MGLTCLYLIMLYAGFSHIDRAQGQTNQPPTWIASSVSFLEKGISEDTPVGTVLGKLQCIDPEEDYVVYRLVVGNYVRVFSNGTFRLSAKLDFEAKASPDLDYNLTFTCVDVNSAGQYMHEPVTINTQIRVLDANDNPPKFDTNNLNGYIFNISKNATLGTVLTPAIRIIDMDRTVNAELDKLYMICHSPFPWQQYNLTEESLAVCRKFMLNYTQESEGLYSAYLTLMEPLEYETQQVYFTSLAAIDGPGVTPQFTTTIDVTINVVDTPDSNPIFINLGTSTTISEGTPIGTTITSLTIAAHGGDLGAKRQVDFTFFNGIGGPFNLTKAVKSTNTDGGYEAFLVLTSPLDREQIDTYNIPILATELDTVSLQRTNAATVGWYTLYVSDINDSPPMFNQTLYSISVEEVEGNNSNAPVQIANIVCSDVDATPNNKFTVRIVNQTFPAYIVNPDGEFNGVANVVLEAYNLQYLDYDNTQYREQFVVLEASEVGTSEKFTSTATLTICITDINDNSPTFEKTVHTFNVSQSETTHQFPALLATDKDSGINGIITYSLSGDVRSLFSIDQQTAVISLNGRLDFETSQYLLLVSATDHGSPPRSSQAQVVINVHSVNATALIFRPASYHISILEGSKTFLNHLFVYATDNKEDSMITYRIKSGNTNNAFAVNPKTGEITQLKALKFEKTPFHATESHTGWYILIIEASNNGNPPLTSTAEVKVLVIRKHKKTTASRFKKNIYKVFRWIHPQKEC